MKSNQKKQQNRKKTGKGFSQGNNREDSALGFSKREPESVNLSRFWILPNNIRVKMRFIQQTLINNAGAAFASLTYIANGLYDVDPRLASTAIPGFTELMTLYQNYRVDSTKIRAVLLNNETFAITISDAFTGIVVPAINSYRPNVYGNKFSRQTAISGKGGIDRVELLNQVNMSALFGSTAYWGDVTQFLGTPATNPSTPLGWAVGIDSAVALVNGVTMQLEMEFICEFSNLGIFTQ